MICISMYSYSPSLALRSARYVATRSGNSLGKALWYNLLWVHLKIESSALTRRLLFPLYVTLDRTPMLDCSRLYKGCEDWPGLEIGQFCWPGLVTSLGSVMLPRVANLLASETIKQSTAKCPFWSIIYLPSHCRVCWSSTMTCSILLREGFPRCSYAIAIMIFRMFFIRMDQYHGDSNSHRMIRTRIYAVLPAIVSVGLYVLFLPHFG